MRVYKCDRCGSYYDVQSQIGPFYAEVQDEHEVYSIDGKSTIKGKDLCEDCMKDLKRWFILFGNEKKNEEDIMTRSIESLEFSVRTYNCLAGAKLCTVKDIVEYDKPLINVRNLGKASLKEIVKKIESLSIPYKFNYSDNSKDPNWYRFVKNV